MDNNNNNNNNEEKKVMDDLLLFFPPKQIFGQRILIKRFVYKMKTRGGILIPHSFSNDKNEVGTMVNLPKFQNRGEVIMVGDAVTKIKEGDIVVFSIGTAEPVFTNPEDIGIITAIQSGKLMEMNEPYVLVDEYNVYYKE